MVSMICVVTFMIGLIQGGTRTLECCVAGAGTATQASISYARGTVTTVYQHPMDATTTSVFDVARTP